MIEPQNLSEHKIQEERIKAELYERYLAEEIQKNYKQEALDFYATKPLLKFKKYMCFPEHPFRCGSSEITAEPNALELNDPVKVQVLVSPEITADEAIRILLETALFIQREASGHCEQEEEILPF